jgi:iron complex outermembrane receptor protein
MRFATKLAALALCALGSAAIQAQAPALNSVFTEDNGSGLLQDAQSSGSLTGTVADAIGGMISRANVTVHNNATGKTMNVSTDSAGHFTVNLPAGSYDVTVGAPGFAASTKKAVQVLDGQSANVALSLQIASASSEVTVEADSTGSIAATLAPMDAVLTAASARTEINAAFINNFTSPVADYGEIVAMAPGTVTVSSDGVGLGQSKTYFRGFPDGDYDIDFDGVPFYDTNTPTHHSWAFFPTQAIGSVDFDRSPGTASTIGPTPFGGSIHLLSKDLSPLQNLRINIASGSFNTYLYDVQYDSGSFGPGHRINFTADVHHLQSHGYQSLNNQNQNAGDIKFQYKISDKTVLDGYSGVIWLDANTPNFSATRCQMYGVPYDGSYSCALTGGPGGLYPETGAGISFLLTNNSDPLLYLDTQYNFYHVPTDFEYVHVKHEFGHNFILEFKPYTYNYDNSEKYANATTITEASTINGSKTYLGLTIAPCNTIVAKKGVYAEPCGVDKYNSYRKYGETSELSQESKYGILRAGFWYEWANTNRHQYPSDPLTNWTDQTLPNFAETFVTDSYQPFVEYQWHATSKLTVTPGVKFAYYTIGTKQFADDGKTVGCFISTVCNPAVTTGINPQAFVSNGGSYFATLPSGSINYRIRNNWSAYFQGATGSIVPPSNVFDYNQGVTGALLPVKSLPQQQKNTTYQAGTVMKLKNVTFDADYYNIHFDNSYSSFTDPTTGEPVYYNQPASISQGFEFEANLNLSHGLGFYANDSYVHATYSGSLAVSCTSGATGCSATTAQITVTAPSGLRVASTPVNIETEGFTYQHKAWDVSFFDKRIGQQYQDVGAYHNQYLVQPFNIANAFVNYTIRTGGRFDQTKFRLSFNNLFNSSSITGVSFANSVTGQTISANGTSYTDPFNATSNVAINGQDNVSILPGRSIMFSMTFGFSPKGR